ncbi:MAG TPA: hypothetical protein DHM37_05870 [Candidatus Cloacimonas sp.]|jgi:uncharacterized linocin/CFP29 family protein|nr:hypothetical protein [Candidatus Cloacimonas sp.]
MLSSSLPPRHQRCISGAIEQRRMVLTSGQDFSFGYQSHTDKKVKLFLTETFTFSVCEPTAVLHLKI